MLSALTSTHTLAVTLGGMGLAHPIHFVAVMGIDLLIDGLVDD